MFVQHPMEMHLAAAHEAAMSLMVLSVLGKVTGAMAKAKDFDSGVRFGT